MSALTVVMRFAASCLCTVIFGLGWRVACADDLRIVVVPVASVAQGSMALFDVIAVDAAARPVLTTLRNELHGTITMGSRSWRCWNLPTGAVDCIC